MLHKCIFYTFNFHIQRLKTEGNSEINYHRVFFRQKGSPDPCYYCNVKIVQNLLEFPLESMNVTIVKKIKM